METLPERTSVAVRAGDLAPDDANLGAVDGLLGGVDVGNTLQEGRNNVSKLECGNSAARLRVLDPAIGGRQRALKVDCVAGSNSSCLLTLPR